jgi:hypothetical protein
MTQIHSLIEAPPDMTFEKTIQVRATESHPLIHGKFLNFRRQGFNIISQARQSFRVSDSRRPGLKF